jgi:hypothetical protein
MTSKEMADLTEKRHDNVKRTIDTLADKGVIGLPQIVEYLDSLGRPATEYQIGKRDSYVIVAQPQIVDSGVLNFEETPSCRGFRNFTEGLTTTVFSVPCTVP